MKQYSVTFITKKGGEENHHMLVMANNAKEAVSVASELWYSENTMHAFRMHAVLCKDIPDTEEPVPEQSEVSEPDTAESAPEREFNRVVCRCCKSCTRLSECDKVMTYDAFSNVTEEMECRCCDGEYTCCSGFTPERDSEELSYINPDYASQECELCSECIHYPECKEEGTVVMQHDSLCMYDTCSSSECCPYFLTSEQIAGEEAELYNWANSLTQSQIDYLCNGGWYNDTIKGYLISAAQEVGFTNEQILELLNGLRFAFSLKDKAYADRLYHDFLVSNDILPF